MRERDLCTLELITPLTYCLTLQCATFALQHRCTSLNPSMRGGDHHIPRSAQAHNHCPIPSIHFHRKPHFEIKARHLHRFTSLLGDRCVPIYLCTPLCTCTLPGWICVPTSVVFRSHPPSAPGCTLPQRGARSFRGSGERAWRHACTAPASRRVSPSPSPPFSPRARGTPAPAHPSQSPHDSLSIFAHALPSSLSL